MPYLKGQGSAQFGVNVIDNTDIFYSTDLPGGYEASLDGSGYNFIGTVVTLDSGAKIGCEYTTANGYTVTIWDAGLNVIDSVYCHTTSFDIGLDESLISKIFITVHLNDGVIDHASVCGDMASSGLVAVSREFNSNALTILNANIHGVSYSLYLKLQNGELFKLSTFNDSYYLHTNVDINSTASIQSAIDDMYDTIEADSHSGDGFLGYNGWSRNITVAPHNISMTLEDDTVIEFSLIYFYTDPGADNYRMRIKVTDGDGVVVVDTTTGAYRGHWLTMTGDTGFPGTGPYSKAPVGDIYFKLNGDSLSSGITIYVVGLTHNTPDDAVVFSTGMANVTSITSSFLNENNIKYVYEDGGGDQGFEDDPTEAGGGDGDTDQDSDDVDEPDEPTVSGSGTGFCRVYAPSNVDLVSLASYLGQTNTDVYQWLKLFFQTNPLDVIISLHTIPLEPDTTSDEEISFGGHGTGIDMTRVTGDYAQFDFGSVQLKPYYGSALDYAPFTTLELYLPFIGYVAVDTDMCMGKTVHLKGQMNVITGEIVFYLSDGDSIIGQWTGTALSTIPITYVTHNNAINSAINMLSTVSGIGMSALAGNVAGAVSSGIGGVGSAMNLIANWNKPEYQTGGSAGGTSGFMMVRKAYFILKRPKKAYPENYKKYVGFPACYTKTLGSCSGFTMFDNIILNVTATDSEKDEMMNYLTKEGVYV